MLHCLFGACIFQVIRGLTSEHLAFPSFFSPSVAEWVAHNHKGPNNTKLAPTYNGSARFSIGLLLFSAPSSPIHVLLQYGHTTILWPA